MLTTKMEINNRLIKKFEESNTILIENKEKYFKIEAIRGDRGTYLLYKNFPLYPEEVGIPKEVRLRGDPRGAKYIEYTDSNKTRTDLEKLHLKFINWLLTLHTTTLFSM